MAVLKFIKNLFVTKNLPYNKTKNNVSINKISFTQFDEIEQKLIDADIDYKIVDELLKRIDKHSTILECKETIMKNLLKILEQNKTNFFEIFENKKQTNKPFVILFFGVNGSGKTTTIGKLINILSQKSSSILVASCDTFRTSAQEQLSEWVNKIKKLNNVNIALEEAQRKNEDPAAVCYRALKRANDEKFESVIIDTSGRLHTNQNLMNELKKIQNTVKKFDQTLPDFNIIVLDGANGLASIRQIEDFSKFVDINGVIVTKLDSSSKAGCIFNIIQNHNLNILFIGDGENTNDLKEFDKTYFMKNLFE